MVTLKVDLPFKNIIPQNFFKIYKLRALFGLFFDGYMHALVNSSCKKRQALITGSSGAGFLCSLYIHFRAGVESASATGLVVSAYLCPRRPASRGKKLNSARLRPRWQQKRAQRRENMPQLHERRDAHQQNGAIGHHNLKKISPFRHFVNAIRLRTPSQKLVCATFGADFSLKLLYSLFHGPLRVVYWLG